MLCIKHWNVAGAFIRPRGMTLYSNRPCMVRKALLCSCPSAIRADGMRLHSRSSARCRSTGAVLTDSNVQNAIAKVVKSAVAWSDTHWMIYWTRKVAKTTPMPAQESWSHQGSLGLVSLVEGSPTRASAMSCDSVTALWSVDGATLGGWSIILALPA